MSQSPDDLVSFFVFCCFFVSFIFFNVVYYGVKTFAAYLYCRSRQKKPRTTRCLFADSCPTFDNCPYNAFSKQRKFHSFKEALKLIFKKRSDDNE